MTEEPSFLQLVLYFMIFAISGYLIEVFVYLVGRQHKLINRGFLFGPWLPIYGFGGLIILKLSSAIPADDIVLTFFTCALVGAGIEYLTSWLLEKIFHMRWWDYSKTRILQINGRVALLNTLGFGLGGCIVIRFILPVISNIINQIPLVWQIVIATVFLILILTDAVVSIYANAKVKNMKVFSKIVGDPAGQIKKYAKMVIKQIFTSSEKMARATKKQLKKAQKEIKKQQKAFDRRQKAFRKDMGKRKKDFTEDMNRRKKDFTEDMKRRKDEFLGKKDN